MFQLMVRGKVLEFNHRGYDQPGSPKAVVVLEVRQWIGEKQVNSQFNVVLDKYWTERLLKLDKMPAYLMFRVSGMTITQESVSISDPDRIHVWLKGEEFFL